MELHDKIAYRRDIDGLRAIAVLAVVFYHLNLSDGGSWLRGGFVGVDIFFVISGFLITGIVQGEIEQGRFTILGFYERRVRRLFPALVVVLVATSLLGAWWLLPSDFALLGKSVAATLMFVSNVFFWRNSGYFNSDSALNPLLHTWSLAVEEQFYIGLPILLLLIFRFRPRFARPIVVALGALSLLACIAVTPLRPSATFYLLPFRAWELLLGAALALGAVPAITSRRLREMTALVGLALVVAGLCMIRPGIGFPGWQAAIPVLGTAMLIHAGSHGRSSVHAFLSLRPLVYVGLISYSLYLWHWPILVYARYRNDLAPLGDLRVWLAVAAFVAAAASYHFVERPFRQRKGDRARTVLFRNAAMVSAVIVALAATIVWSNGMPWRFPPQVVALDLDRAPVVPFLSCDGRTPSLADTQCRLGSPLQAPDLLLWGDSHALSWAPVFDEALRRRGKSAQLAVNLACPPLAGIHNPVNVECRDFNRQVLSHIREHPEYRTIVIHASWLDYSLPSRGGGLVDSSGRSGNQVVFAPALMRTVQMLRQQGRQIWIIGPTPGAPSAAPLRLAMSQLHGSPAPAPRSAMAFARNAAYFNSTIAPLRRDSGVRITDPSRWLCDAESCAYVIDGQPLYRDGGHLSSHGARYLLPFLASAMDQALQGAAPQALASMRLGAIRQSSPEERQVPDRETMDSPPESTKPSVILTGEAPLPGPGRSGRSASTEESAPASGGAGPPKRAR